MDREGVAGQRRAGGLAARWRPGPGQAAQDAPSPQGTYFVAPWVPDVIGYNAPNMPGLAAGPISLADSTLYVGRSQVQGRVFYKLHPLSELGRVR